MPGPAAGVRPRFSRVQRARRKASLAGGRASVIGAMVGAIVMGVLQNGLNLLAVPNYYQPVAIGTILIATIALDRPEKGRA